MRRAFCPCGTGAHAVGAPKDPSLRASRVGRYRVSTLDRIEAAGQTGPRAAGGAPNTTSATIVSDDDDDIGRAGAFPMNTLDRIKRAEIDATRSAPPSVGRRTYSTQSRPVAVAKPDAWRYRWFENRWWYYAPGNQWYYRTANRWQVLSSPTAEPATAVSSLEFGDDLLS